MDWLDLAKDRDRWWALVNAAMSLRVTSNEGNFLTGLELIRFSRRPLLHGVSK